MKWFKKMFGLIQRDLTEREAYYKDRADYIKMGGIEPPIKPYEFTGKFIGRRINETRND